MESRGTVEKTLYERHRFAVAYGVTPNILVIGSEAMEKLKADMPVHMIDKSMLLEKEFAGMKICRAEEKDVLKVGYMVNVGDWPYSDSNDCNMADISGDF